MTPHTARTMMRPVHDQASRSTVSQEAAPGTRANVVRSNPPR